MAKSKSKKPLRSCVNSSKDSFFNIDDMGDGLYHLHLTTKGIELLHAYGEHVNPLNNADMRAFVGLCDLLQSQFLDVVNLMGEENNSSDENKLVPDDDLIPF